FRGMCDCELRDEATQTLFCARDRFCIKPLYYTMIGGILYFASEIKALLPFVDAIETDLESVSEYLTFQFCLGGKTLFKGISELLPAHTVRVSNGTVEASRYWQVYYDQIGRASCRERVEDSVGGGAVKKKMERHRSQK